MSSSFKQLIHNREEDQMDVKEVRNKEHQNGLQRCFATNYWLRDIPRLNYKYSWKNGINYEYSFVSPRRIRNSSEYFRSHKNDLHLELSDNTHYDINLIVRGMETIRQKTITFKFYEVYTGGKVSKPKQMALKLSQKKIIF